MGLAISFWPFGGKKSGPAPAWQRRLHAWWEGYDVEALDRRRARGAKTGDDGTAPAASSGDTDADPDTGHGEPGVDEAGVVWGEARRKLVQLLWGEGLVGPGGVEYVHELANGLALSPSVSMLEVGAGMCGGSRAVVEKFGTYVTALERDTDLVEIGRAQNVAAGCDDKITLDPLVPSSLGLKKEYFEAALARDALFTIENQQEVLTEIIRSLKPEGQIMLTDLFFDADDDDDALAAWRSAEPEPVHPWTIDAVKDIFAGANVLTRIAADETAAYRTMALATWDDFQYKVKQGTVPAELMDTMLREAEVWTRRMAAMDGGALRYYRVLGVKNS